jgi:hypothetical protein
VRPWQILPADPADCALSTMRTTLFRVPCGWRRWKTSEETTRRTPSFDSLPFVERVGETIRIVELRANVVSPQTQWGNTLATYAFPTPDSLPVAAIDVGLVIKPIEPIWQAKPETASRVRGRVESVLDWATARGYRTGENPARWKGHLDKMLPARAKLQRVAHHPALPYAEMAEFMVKLREREGIAARALEFCRSHRRSRRRQMVGIRLRGEDVAGSGGADEGWPRASGGALRCGDRDPVSHGPERRSRVPDFRHGDAHAAAPDGANRSHGPRLPLDVCRLGVGADGLPE